MPDPDLGNEKPNPTTGSNQSKTWTTVGVTEYDKELLTDLADAMGVPLSEAFARSIQQSHSEYFGETETQVHSHNPPKETIINPERSRTEFRL